MIASIVGFLSSDEWPDESNDSLLLTILEDSVLAGIKQSLDELGVLNRQKVDKNVDGLGLKNDLTAPANRTSGSFLVGLAQPSRILYPDIDNFTTIRDMFKFDGNHYLVRIV
jgi:hypothetical protein